MNHFLKTYPRAKMWLALGALCCVVAVGAWIDARMKAADSWGYAPAEAQFQIAAHDLPGAWRTWQSTPTAQAMDTNLSRQLHDVALFFRKSTGIRPTPLRVSAWLGQRVLVGLSLQDSDAPEWGLCVHPGILLRIAHVLNRMLGNAPNGDIYHLYDWHYAWRDGFLVASLSEKYVSDALAAPLQNVESKDADVTVQWQGDHAGSIALHADNDLSFDAQWRGVLPALPRTRKSGVMPDADTEAIFSVLGGAPAPYLQWLAAPEQPWHEGVLKPALEVAAPWWAAWVRADALSKMEVDAFNFSLNEVDLAQHLPIPVWTLTLQTPVIPPGHPLLEVINSAAPMPFAWGDNKGVLLPLSGPSWTLALQGKNRIWHCASQEAEMNRYLSANAVRPTETKSPQIDLQLMINWQRLAICANTLANYAANNELIPWNARELPEHLSPWLDFLQACGHFELSATSEKDNVVAAGHINQKSVSP